MNVRIPTNRSESSPLTGPYHQAAAIVPLPRAWRANASEQRTLQNGTLCACDSRGATTGRRTGGAPCASSSNVSYGGDEFSDEDWLHALDGVHFLLVENDEIRAHAAVVERDLRLDRVALRTGYVEAVATAPAHQRKGLGTQIMREARVCRGEL
jgi:ribosomal protein S18 acetylase RimI-like enzyme